jgi:hypothetical protein
LHENFWWRALPAYVITIFSTYCLSYGAKWDVFLCVEGILGHTAGRIIIEVVYFVFCLLWGMCAVWLIIEFIGNRNDPSFCKFLKKIEAESEENKTESIN